MSLVATEPQPVLALKFENSNVDYITELSPSASTPGTYAAPSGGTITTSGGNRIHTFNSTGTTSITFLVPITIQLLVVAGGGGGGGNNTSASSGGGGGAGEYYYSASYSVQPGTYTVTVGDGGIAGIASGADGGDGGASVFDIISANGGGGGSTGGSGRPGRDGGSGGGCGRAGATTGGASVKTAGGLGNKGGDCVEVSSTSGAGGGGSATAGTDASPSGSIPVPGGNGSANSISGASVTYAAGGTGGSRSGIYTPSAGTANRGNGGDGGPAGGTAGSNARNGGAGGSGIVVISYNNALYPEPTYVSGKYLRAISFNNTLSPTGADPNCYVLYDVSSFNLSSNAAAMSLWLNSGLTYPTTAGTAPFYVNLQGNGYNGLYTAGPTSNISFRKGLSPSTTVGNVAAQTGVWQHHCAVFSNVGAETSNTITSYYVNGSLIGFANTHIQTFSTLYLGCQTRTTNGALCSIDDVRLFNAALTATQVQSVYNQQGVPGRFVLSLPSTPSMFLTGAPLFSQLSSSAVASSVGAFSLRAVNGVTARAVQVVAHPVGIWPPVAMTSNNFTATGTFNGVTNGAYTASQSPNAFEGQNNSYLAFDNNPTDTYWHSALTYDGTGAYIGTTTQPDGYTGEWLQIQFPTPIILYSYSMINRSGQNPRSPKNFRIYASNDGTNWVIVDTRSNITQWLWPNRLEFTITNPSMTPYSYFRMVVNATSGPNSIQISSWILNGPAAAYISGSATDFYADSAGNLLTAPVTGQSLASWLNGATGYVSAWYDQSGAGNHVSQATAASQPSITTTGTLMFSGAQSFSNSATTGGCLVASAGTGTKYSYGAVWNPSVLSGYQTICEHNSSTGITSKRSSLLLNTTSLGFNGQSNDIQALIGGLVTNTQYSTVARIDNTVVGYTANGNKNVRMRQNGVDYSAATGNYATLNLDNYWFAIGRKASTNGEFFNGSMKSVMVFKDALSDADTAILHAWQQSI